ncbi:MAG TPA: PIG-L family deacetylase, partial [Armatimonadota bacterium]|nr:PIG-L family deacetylase [Armatimonadota bacterium]
EFSAGATMRKHVRAGWDAHIIQLTLGEKGNPNLSTVEYGAQKRAEADSACGVLGITSHYLPYKDAELTATDDVAREIAILLRKLQPTVIIAHWKGSIHSDHIAAHHLAHRGFFMAANPHFDLGPESPKRARWARFYYADNWEDPEGFRPYTFVDISDEMQEWKQAFDCFAIGRGEGGYPYWDWYEARTRIHGIGIGTEHAQAFAVDESRMREVKEML